MKKIFAILALFLAFSISAVAHEGQKNPDTAASADLSSLKKVVQVSKASEI